MANGHIEIQDPISNQDPTSHTDCKSTSDADSMDDSVEYRVMMAYAQRRRRKTSTESPKLVAQNGGLDSNGTSSPQTPAKAENEAPEKEEEEKEEKKKGGKKIWRHLPKIFRCIKPQTTDEEPQKPQKTPESPDDVVVRCGDFPEDDVTEDDQFDQVASRLTEIADEIPFTPPEVESDAPDDEVEKVIGLLLRESGDRLNERELKNASIAAELFRDYRFFDTLITTLLRRMGLWTPDPDAPGPQTSPKTQIAVACEVTSRLSAVDTLPMNRLLGFGATYLQNHYSSWAEQQGGYEAAFDSEEEDDVQ